MSNTFDRLHLRILREAHQFSVFVQTIEAGSSENWQEAEPLEWSQVEGVAKPLLSAITEINLRRNIENASQHFSSLGRDLFRVAFPGEIGERIRSSSREFLVLDLNAEAVGIPWELAHDGTEFLGCRFSMGRLVQEWDPAPVNSRSRPTGKCSMLLLSNPTGDLPAAAREGEAISNLLTDEEGQEVIWLNDRVEPQTLRQWLPKADLFHYCGHFTEGGNNKDESGMELAGGRFTTGDLAATGREGRGVPYLVFNNACHGGEGRSSSYCDDGNDFTASFLKQGCLHYIGAYSKIVDRQGSEFAEAFYHHTLNGGAIGTALRLARMEVRSKYEDEHLTWAQYVLYGEPAKGLYGERAAFAEVHTLLFVEPGHFATVLRDLVRAFPESEIVDEEVAPTCILFSRPSEAVRFALLFLTRATASQENEETEGSPRLAITNGEILVERGEGAGCSLGIRGVAYDVGKLLLRLARPRQILTSRPVHDNARAMLHGDEIPEVGKVSWLDHGDYAFGDLEDLLDVCEVGEKEGNAPLHPPPDTSFANRSISPNQEPVLGWRPALDNEIPTTPEWVLIEKLGAGGFGEVWRAKHRDSGATRVFKFCFRADRVRSLKREVTLFRVLRNRLGPHPHIVGIHDVFFEEPPFYISMEDVQGLDLGKWLDQYGDDERVDESVRLEIIAKVADGLQAAHDAGVIHRDIKPSNILVEGTPEHTEEIDIKLTDFGIGQVELRQILGNVTAAGFTETFGSSEMSSGSGSRLYMAPELLVGKESSIRSDIYSLGMVLYQILLKDCDHPLTVNWEQDIQDPILLEDLRLCLTGEATDRLSSAADLADRLRRVVERRKERREEEERIRYEARRKKVCVVAGASVVAILTVTAALGIGLYMALQAEEKAERSLYYSRIQQAEHAQLDEDPVRAREILYDCPKRFRGWEWGRLLYLCSTDHRAFLGHEAKVSTLEISPDGSILAVGDEGGLVKIWDFARGDLLCDLDCGDSVVRSISINRDSTRIAVADLSTVQVWNLGDRKKTHSFRGVASNQDALHFGPDRDLLVATYAGANLYLYDLENGTTTEIESGHSESVRNFCFTPDGERLVTAGRDGDCRILDIETGESVGRVKASDVSVNDIVLDREGKYFAVATSIFIKTGTMDPFEITSGRMQVSGAAMAIDFSPSRDYVGILTNHGFAEVLELESLGSPYKRGGASGGLLSIRFTPDGRYLLTLEADRCVRQRPLQGSRIETLALNGHSEFVSCLAFSPDGKILATGSEDQTVVLWDTLEGKEIRTLTTHDSVRSLSFNPDGSLLAAGTADGITLIWDPRSGEPLQPFMGHGSVVASLDFSPDGRSLATAGEDKVIRVWNMTDFSQELSIEAHISSVFAVAFAPDGETLVSAGGGISEDEFVREWDARSGELVRSYVGHQAPARAVAFSPSGAYFATGGDDRLVYYWDRRTGESVASMEADVKSPHDLLISPDGRRMFTFDELWDLESFLLISSVLEGPKALSPDGLVMARAGGHDRMSLSPAFPFREEELSPDTGLQSVEKVEEYKRKYWAERPFTATGRVGPAKPKTSMTDKVGGCWNFLKGNFEAEIGRSLEWYSREPGRGKELITFKRTTELGIPHIGGREAATTVIPGLPGDIGILLFSKSRVEDRSNLNTYTLIFDLYYPRQSDGRRRALYNTDGNNSNPAELVVSATGGLGVDGVYQGKVEVDMWNRVAVAVDLESNPRMEKYINGVHVGTQSLPKGENGRWAVRDGTRGRALLLFAAPDADDVPTIANSIQIREYSMTADEIAALGGPTADGIPIEDVVLKETP